MIHRLSKPKRIQQSENKITDYKGGFTSFFYTLIFLSGTKIYE